MQSSSSTSPLVPATVVVDAAPASPDEREVLGSLSPSRAADFLSCPLLFRFRSIDRLPEAPSPAAVRGTVVHRVLEDLFDLPAVERTPARADALVVPSWEAVLAAAPELAAMFAPADPSGPEPAAWLETCRTVLATYFSLEDPRRLEPAERELYVESVLDSRLLLRGYVDRLDVAADGALRIVDYKTGRSPREGYEAQALFQLKFYALVLWRSRGVVASMLQLIYLGNGEILRYRPDELDLLATERKVEAVWRAIEEARLSGAWTPRPGRLCDWCSFRALCPAFGGTPPPVPQPMQPPGLTDRSAPPTAPPGSGR